MASQPVSSDRRRSHGRAKSSEIHGYRSRYKKPLPGYIQDRAGKLKS